MKLLHPYLLLPVYFLSKYIFSFMQTHLCSIVLCCWDFHIPIRWHGCSGYREMECRKWEVWVFHLYLYLFAWWIFLIRCLPFFQPKNLNWSQCDSTWIGLGWESGLCLSIVDFVQLKEVSTRENRLQAASENSIYNLYFSYARDPHLVIYLPLSNFSPFFSQITIWWAGLMRGAVSMALAYNQV